MVMYSTKVYTPDQVATLLQLSTNTVYDLIGRGEIIAKKIGKVYRVPANSISFVFTGMDFDLYQAEVEDRKSLPLITDALRQARQVI
ncbi:MAG: helix-turn-helix domain-containing protein [Patescibacteria group bacterium]